MVLSPNPLNLRLHRQEVLTSAHSFPGSLISLQPPNQLFFDSKSGWLVCGTRGVYLEVEVLCGTRISTWAQKRKIAGAVQWIKQSLKIFQIEMSFLPITELNSLYNIWSDYKNDILIKVQICEPICFFSHIIMQNIENLLIKV